MADPKFRHGGRRAAGRGGKGAQPASPASGKSAKSDKGQIAPRPVSGQRDEHASASPAGRAEDQDERERLRSALSFRPAEGDISAPGPGHASPSAGRDAVDHPTPLPGAVVADQPAPVSPIAGEMVLDRLDVLVERLDRLDQPLEQIFTRVGTESRRLLGGVEALLRDREARLRDQVLSMPATVANDDSAVVDRLERLAASVERLAQPAAAEAPVGSPDQVVGAVDSLLQSHEVRVREMLSAIAAGMQHDTVVVLDTLSTLTTRVDALIQPLEKMSQADGEAPRQMVRAVESLWGLHEAWMEEKLAAIAPAPAQEDSAVLARIDGLAGRLDQLTAQLEVISPWFVEGPQKVLETVEAMLYTHGTWLDEEATAIRSWVAKEMTTMSQRSEEGR